MNINKFDFKAAEEALGGMKVTLRNNEIREKQFRKQLLKQHKAFFNKTLSDRRVQLIRMGGGKQSNKKEKIETNENLEELKIEKSKKKQERQKQYKPTKGHIIEYKKFVSQGNNLKEPELREFCETFKQLQKKEILKEKPPKPIEQPIIDRANVFSPAKGYNFKHIISARENDFQPVIQRYQDRPSILQPGIHDLDDQSLLQFTESQSQSLQQEDLKDLSNMQWIFLLKHSNMIFCPYSTLKRVLKDREIMNGIAIYLTQNITGDFNRTQLEYALIQGDRDLFVKFRDKKITYDQLRARGAEKNGYATYIVLDDVRHKLNPIIVDPAYEKTYRLRFGKKGSMQEIPNPPIEEITRPMEDWELEHRCLRSLKFKHVYKQSEKQIEEQKLAKLKKEQKDILESQKQAEILKNERKEYILKLKPKTEAKLSKKDQKNEIVDIRERFNEHLNQYSKKFLSSHREFVRCQSAFISNRVYENNSLVARLDMPDLQFGKQSEFQNLQKEVNKLVSEKEQRNREKQINLKRQESTAKLIPNVGNLIFMKRLQEDGKDITISKKHQKKLFVQDFIDKAIEYDKKPEYEQIVEKPTELEAFQQKIRKLKNHNVQSYQQYIEEMDSKRQEIEQDMPPKVIGLPGKCPILSSKKRLSETHHSISVLALGRFNEPMKPSYGVTALLNSPRSSLGKQLKLDFKKYESSGLKKREQIDTVRNLRKNELINTTFQKKKESIISVNKKYESAQTNVAAICEQLQSFEYKPSETVDFKFNPYSDIKEKTMVSSSATNSRQQISDRAFIKNTTLRQKFLNSKLKSQAKNNSVDVPRKSSSQNTSSHNSCGKLAKTTRELAFHKEIADAYFSSRLENTQSFVSSKTQTEILTFRPSI